MTLLQRWWLTYVRHVCFVCRKHMHFFECPYTGWGWECRNNHIQSSSKYTHTKAEWRKAEQEMYAVEEE